MFFSAGQIARSIAALVNVHPFHGITFLVCKKEGLPIGSTTNNFSLDSKTASFLEKYHRVDPDSKYFFQPFKSSSLKKKWVKPNYPATGLQAINTQTFKDAFLHQLKTGTWGWQKNYVSFLSSKLPQEKKIPMFHLAVWLYREKKWSENVSVLNVIDFFIEDFSITEEEKESLFDILPPPSPNGCSAVFQPNKPSWSELQPIFPPAPDARPDQGGILAYLEIRGLGPAERFVLEPAKRLTLITGDNGLGKTFLLECAWWALTGIWADRPAYPISGRQEKKAQITFAIESEHVKTEKREIPFDLKTLSWPQPEDRPTIPGLSVYARVDGSFAVWDPVKQVGNITDVNRNKSVFTSAEVWDGLQGRIEGLIRDWVRWQNSPSKHPFDIFIQVLSCLSPPDLGKLEPGDPVRIPGDLRDIPTIKHAYGITPVFYASAGVRRIITLAYLIVWAWNEHVVEARLAETQPQRRMVVLIDEMEAHLHPRWQRMVLPALMSVGKALDSNLEVQYIVATHSPLVLASSETVFDDKIDSLVHLDLSDSGEVSLRVMDYIPFGDISSWLTSPVFELKHARSLEAEGAIEAAKALQLQDNPATNDVKEASGRLLKYLSPNDIFWPRWIAFAEKFGVEI